MPVRLVALDEGPDITLKLLGRGVDAAPELCGHLLHLFVRELLQGKGSTSRQ